MDIRTIIVAVIAVMVVGSGVLFFGDNFSQEIELSVSGDEGIDHVDGPGFYGMDTYVDLYAKTKDGYAFAGWYDEDGKLLSDKREYSVFVQEPTELKVKTVKGYEVTVYTMTGIDTVTGAGAHRSSETVTLKATVEKGYTFAGWYDLDGKLVNNRTSFTLSGKTDTVLVAKTKNVVYTGENRLQYNDSKADTWIVTDWFTGDYVFSKTGTTYLDMNLGPGIYRVTRYGPDAEYLGSLKEYFGGKVIKEFSWKHDRKTYTAAWTTDYNEYFKYLGADRPRAPMTTEDRLGFVNYASDSVKGWADYLMGLSKDMTDLQRADFVLDFVQQCVTYELDEDYCHGVEYWKYPYETLFDGRGDCEDSAILYCALMKSMGYDTALLLFVGEEYVDAGHAAASVALENVPGGTYYENGGKKYYYCETTNDDFGVGESPEGYDSAEMLIVR
ncbi:MAG: InlB B-repeat-containing protein [archaeon]|nr:InlB B-repeat-containing protein [archaeon]